MASDWEWWGKPGHFIAAHNCRFHLHTHVGAFCVSTVGDYHPPAHGDESADGYGETKEPKTVGLDRLYETMVFRLGDDGETVDWAELDFGAYNDEHEAMAGHVALCEKWAAKAPSAAVESERDRHA